MWSELWIEMEISVSALVAAVAKAHGIAEGDVEVVDGIASPLRGAVVAVHRTKGGGQFAMRVQLSGAEPADRRVFAARLASALACKVLGDDGNVNPATFMLYQPGEAVRVLVNPQRLDDHKIEIVGPYAEQEDDDLRLTQPVRRYPSPTAHRQTRGEQVAHIVNDYMVEGLPRLPVTPWAPEITELYANLQRLIGTIAFRTATPEELANITAWSAKLRTTFSDPEKAGWFVPELLEAAEIVLAEAWDPDQPAIELKAR